MVLVVSGFGDKVQALQFEWAWQRPASCRATRALARARGVSDKTSAPGKKAMVMCGMLNTAPWKHMPLTVHCMSEVGERLIEKYADAIPAHVERRRTTTREMDAIVAASANAEEEETEEEMDDAMRARVMDVGVSGTPSASASASRPGGEARRCGVGRVREGDSKRSRRRVRDVRRAISSGVLGASFFRSRRGRGVVVVESIDPGPRAVRAVRKTSHLGRGDRRRRGERTRDGNDDASSPHLARLTSGTAKS